MPVALKRSEVSTDLNTRPSPFTHFLWFIVAGLFVSVLALSYGVDLSPGLF